MFLLHPDSESIRVIPCTGWSKEWSSLFSVTSLCFYVAVELNLRIYSISASQQSRWIQPEMSIAHTSPHEKWGVYIKAASLMMRFHSHRRSQIFRVHDWLGHQHPWKSEFLTDGVSMQQSLFIMESDGLNFACSFFKCDTLAWQAFRNLF